MLERAVNVFAFASAFTPAKSLIADLRSVVRDIRRSLKVTSWGN